MLVSLPWNVSERHSENLHLFWFHGTEFRVVFCSAEWFRTDFREFASIFVLRNGIPTYFLFLVRVQNGIREYASIFVPRNGIPSCFLFR